MEELTSLKIGDKTYDLHIGFAFIRELDKRHNIDAMGLEFGVGVGQTLANLHLRNPLAVLDFVQAATITERQKPSLEDIEALFKEWHEQDKTDEMFELFIKRLETHYMTAPVVKAYQQEMRTMSGEIDEKM